jgi:hypothetical protein
MRWAYRRRSAVANDWTQFVFEYRSAKFDSYSKLPCGRYEPTRSVERAGHPRKLVTAVAKSGATEVDRFW